MHRIARALLFLVVANLLVGAARADALAASVPWEEAGR